MKVMNGVTVTKSQIFTLKIKKHLRVVKSFFIPGSLTDGGDHQSCHPCGLEPPILNAASSNLVKEAYRSSPKPTFLL